MKDKIKYYLLLLAFLFIMALILWFFHDWIEQYSNSLMVLITFIYVVATIEICRANIKSAEATKEQLEESKHQFAENERLQMMPYFEIIVHDDIRDFVECIELTISNSNAENSTVVDRRISIKILVLVLQKTLHTHGAIWTDVIRGTTLLLQHLLREKKKPSTLIFMPNIKRTLANMKLRYQ